MAAKRKRPNPPVRGERSSWILHGARLLLVLALAVSAYLAWVSLAHGTVVGCGPDSGCDKVLQSRWARWFGVPVSLLALGVDALLLGWSFRLNAGTAPALQRQAWNWIVPCSLLVAGAAVWFVGLQLFEVRAICPYCMVAHVSGFAAALFLLRALPQVGPAVAREKGKEVDRPRVQFTRQIGLAGGLAGLALAGLILGQVLYHPKTFLVTSLGADTNVAPANTAGAANATGTAARPGLLSQNAETNGGTATTPAVVAGTPALGTGPERLFPVYGGRFEIKLHEVPRSGAITNEQVIVSLFDYTCHHCRLMHPLLAELQRTFSNRLVIANLPMPLDPGCNPTVVRLNPKHTNACEYARLGLAVWRADPAKHAAYDHWLMEGEDQAPPLEEARQQAIAMVGEQALRRASQDPWVEQQLRQDVSLYQFAYANRQGSMPQLIFASGLAVGTYSREDLFKMIGNNLGLKVQP